MSQQPFQQNQIGNFYVTNQGGDEILDQNPGGIYPGSPDTIGLTITKSKTSSSQPALLIDSSASGTSVLAIQNNTASSFDINAGNGNFTVDIFGNVSAGNGSFTNLSAPNSTINTLNVTNLNLSSTLIASGILISGSNPNLTFSNPTQNFEFFTQNTEFFVSGASEIFLKSDLTVSGNSFTLEDTTFLSSGNNLNITNSNSNFSINLGGNLLPLSTETLGTSGSRWTESYFTSVDTLGLEVSGAATFKGDFITITDLANTDPFEIRRTSSLPGSYTNPTLVSHPNDQGTNRILKFYTGSNFQNLASSFDAIVPDDYATPGAALSDGKKRIFVRSGTYNDSGSNYNSNVFGIRIVGEGSNNTIWRFRQLTALADFSLENLTLGDDSDGTGNSFSQIIIDNSDVASFSEANTYLNNLVLDGNSSNSAGLTDKISVVNGANAILSNIVVTGTSGPCVSVSNSKNIKITNLRIEGTDSILEISNSEAVSVENVAITGVISSSLGFISLVNAKNCNVRNVTSETIFVPAISNSSYLKLTGSGGGTTLSNCFAQVDRNPLTNFPVAFASLVDASGYSIENCRATGDNTNVQFEVLQFSGDCHSLNVRGISASGMSYFSSLSSSTTLKNSVFLDADLRMIQDNATAGAFIVSESSGNEISGVFVDNINVDALEDFTFIKFTDGNFLNNQIQKVRITSEESSISLGYLSVDDQSNVVTLNRNIFSNIDLNSLDRADLIDINIGNTSGSIASGNMFKDLTFVANQTGPLTFAPVSLQLSNTDYNSFKFLNCDMRLSTAATNGIFYINLGSSAGATVHIDSSKLYSDSSGSFGLVEAIYAVNAPQDGALVLSNSILETPNRAGGNIVFVSGVVNASHARFALNNILDNGGGSGISNWTAVGTQTF